MRSEKQEARSEKQEARGKKQEARGKKQEVRGKKQEERGKMQEVRNKKKPIKSYKDLKVYRLSYKLAIEIFHLSKKFPITSGIWLLFSTHLVRSYFWHLASCIYCRSVQ